MRRIVLLLTAVLLLLIGGFLLWQLSGCRIVGNTVCTDRTRQLDLSGQPLPSLEALTGLRALQELDLRDTGLTMDQYDLLQATLPGCSIAWSVPFGGEYYPNDTLQLSVTALTEADLRALGYFPQLETIDATRCTELSTIVRLQELLPSCHIDYTVTLNGQALSKDTETLVLGSDSTAHLAQVLPLLPKVREVDASQCRDYAGLLALQQQYPQISIRYLVKLSGTMVGNGATSLSVTDPVLSELEAALAGLPNLQTVELTGPLPDNESLHALQLRYPGIRFLWSFSLCGVTVSTADTAINLSGIAMESTAQVEAALPCFYDLQTVEMCDCGIPSREMAAMGARNPQVRFIWTVKIGSQIRLRTDATYLMPFQYGVTLTDADTEELQYCTDMLCLDLGHSMITDVSFLAHMPKLQYLTLGETPVSDISALAGAQELVFLELFLTNVTDYSPLLSCPKLRDLNISYAIPGDMTVLCQLKQVKHLHLKGLWQDEWQQQLRTALPETTLVFAGTGDISSTGDGWRQLENYYKMRDILGMPYMSY